MYSFFLVFNSLNKPLLLPSVFWIIYSQITRGTQAKYGWAPCESILLPSGKLQLHFQISLDCSRPLLLKACYRRYQLLGYSSKNSSKKNPFGIQNTLTTSTWWKNDSIKLCQELQEQLVSRLVKRHETLTLSYSILVFGDTAGKKCVGGGEGLLASGMHVRLAVHIGDDNLTRKLTLFSVAWWR